MTELTENWEIPREELTDAELAPPQNFIGPRFYPPKYLYCCVCGAHVKIADKYRRARRANCCRQH